MRIETISQRRFLSTAFWAFVASIIIVIVASVLGRATLNLNAAVTDKPDIAIYLLLPQEGIRDVTFLRGTATERDYLAETSDGPKLVTLHKEQDEWTVKTVEKLHE